MVRKNLNTKKGITLVALVITIVILIILAGVALSLVLGSNGILQRTKDAKVNYTNASAEEQGQLTDAEKYLNDLGGTATEGDINWDEVLKNATKDPAQSSTNEDIGIGPDGKSVNLDLWTYQLSDDKTYYILQGEYLTQGQCNPSYKGTITDGKLDENIPVYIKDTNYNNETLKVEIGDGAFSSLTNLKDIIIPSSVTRIGYYAFSGCTSLSSITIPSSVTSIGDFAFYVCTSLSSITIPSSVTSIGSAVFEGCTSLSSITIPSNVTSIGDAAFDSCTSLSNITIPSSVTSIGMSAFSDCTSLSSINVDSNNSNYSSENGILFNKDKTELIQCPQGIINNEYIIPSSVTSIKEYAFEDCTNLSSITIPSSVTSIEEWAFHGCTSLNSITIPDNVTSIGIEAFYEWNSTQTINVYWKEGNKPSGWNSDWATDCNAKIVYA